MITQKMSGEGISKNTVLKVFRQIAGNVDKKEQDQFWQFVSTKMPTTAKRGIHKAIEKGPDSGRASIANAIKEWRTSIYLQSTPSSGSRQQQQQQGKQQQQQYNQPQQQQRQQQQQQQHTQRPQQLDHKLASGKGKGEGGTRQWTPTGERNTEGRGRGGDGPGKGSSKGPARGRTPWTQLLIDEQTPLLDPQGNVSKKCTLTPEDEDEEVDKAGGYVMASAATASKLVGKIARRRDWTRPLVIVHQAMNPRDKAIMRDTLKEWEDDLNLNATEENPFAPYSFDISETAVVVKDPYSDTLESREVILIHFHPEHTLLPPSAEDAATIGLEVAPELTCPEERDDEIAVTVIRPLCEEAGLAEWAKEFFDLQDKKELEKAIKKIVRGPKATTDLQMRIFADRTIKYRGQVMQGAKIRAIIRVPKEEVDELLSRSGKFGVLYDFPDRARSDNLKKVNLPLEWDINDAIKAVEELQVQARQAVLGIVPSARGFAARVRADNEAMVIPLLCPELASQLGASMGIQPNSTWAIKNLPRRLNKQDLIAMLATPVGSWTSWHVLPKYTIGDRPPRGITWIVEAEEPPPVKILKARGSCITIERFINERAMNPAVRIWAKPIAQWEKSGNLKTSRQGMRKPWHEYEDDDVDFGTDGSNDAQLHPEGRESSGRTTDDHLGSAEPQTLRQPTGTDQSQTLQQHNSGRTPCASMEMTIARPAQTRPRSFNLTDSSSTDTAPPRNKCRFGDHKRKASAWPAIQDTLQSDAKADQERSAMLAAMQAKDAQIAELTNTLARLQQTMETLMVAMTANGTLPQQVAAGVLAELQTAAATPQADQDPSMQRQQQLQQENSMWTGEDEAPADHGDDCQM